MQSLDLAVDYTKRVGWGVFPCRNQDEIDAETGEIFSAKSPLISNGLRGATKNERIIREWFGNRHPSALVGAPTGENMGAWVLDVDIKHGVGDGFEWIAEMEDIHGKLPRTATVETPRGGRHLYFKHVPGIKNRANIGHCIDVRGAGGFVILAGSRMTDGRAYEWLDDTGPDDIADAPQWLLDLVLPPAQVASPATPYSYQKGGNDQYVESAVQAELDKLAGTTEGRRGEQLNTSAFSLGTLVGAGALSRPDAEAGLYRAAIACGIVKKDGERASFAKIKRGLDAGMRQPRAIPERQQQQNDDNTRLVDISRMIANGLAKAKGKAQTPVADETGDDAPEAPAAPQDTPATPALAITATPFEWINPKTLKRREFAYGTHYIRKYVSVTVSPGGLGKTSNSIVEALSMTSGRDLTGIKPPQRMRVWVFNAEDPREEMDRRIMAACLHYKLKPKDINGHLFMDTGREQELVVAIDDKRGVKIQVPIVEAVVEQLKRNAIDVMIVDPFVSTHSVNENDNGAIDKVAKLWAQIADETNVAIDVVHHLRKVSDREATVEDARGAVALIGAARSVRVLNRMSQEQAVAACVSEEDRFSYFNIHQGKANLTRMATGQDWRQLVSVALGNGDPNPMRNKLQDHAGVVTRWTWPGAEEIARALPDDHRAAIKVALDNGNYKLGNRAKDWAGGAVAFAMGLDIDVPGERKRAASVLKAMLKEGELVQYDLVDKARRERATYIRSAEWVAGVGNE